MDIEFNFTGDGIPIRSGQQLANGMKVLAENFIQRICVLAREHRARGSIDFVDAKIGIDRDYAGRDAFENDLHITPAGFKLACGGLQLSGHVIE